MGRLPLRASALHGSVAHSPRHSPNQHIANSASSRCWVLLSWIWCNTNTNSVDDGARRFIFFRNVQTKPEVQNHVLL